MHYLLVLFFFLFSAVAHAQVTTSGGATVSGGVVAGASAVGTGNIMLERQGEHATAGRETAPYATTKVDGGTAVATNPNVITSLTAGSHTVTATDIPAFVETAGTCTYAIGGAECSVSSFGITPTCSAGSCSTSVSVTGGQVTKVAFKYEGVYPGWGNAVTGGKTGTVVHVTNCNSSGAGSLVEAVKGDNRYIVFDQSCTITHPGDASPYENVNICDSGITIDGFTAPSPGITISKGSIDIENSIPATGVPAGWTGRTATLDCGTENIIVRGLRLRKAVPFAFADAGLQWAINIKKGYSNWFDGTTPPVQDIVIAHNSLSGSPDDMILLSQGTFNVSVIGNLFADANQHMLLEQKAYKVTTYLNFFGGPSQFSYRNPMDTYVTVYENNTGPATMTQDVRNNFIHMRTPSYAISGWRRSAFNVVNNYLVYGPPTTNADNGHAIGIDPIDNTTLTYNGQSVPAHEVWYAYIDGNVLKPDPLYCQTNANHYLCNHNLRDYDHQNPAVKPTTPLSTPAMTTLAAVDVPCFVMATAGVFPRDTLDTNALAPAVTDLTNVGGITCP